MEKLFEQMIAIQDEHSNNLALYGLHYKNSFWGKRVELTIKVMELKINVLASLANLFSHE